MRTSINKIILIIFSSCIFNFLLADDTSLKERLIKQNETLKERLLAAEEKIKKEREKKVGIKFNTTKDLFEQMKENRRVQEGQVLNTKDEVNSVEETSSDKLNMTEAKATCLDIGFKKGTEKFGECVLQLTK